MQKANMFVQDRRVRVCIYTKPSIDFKMLSRILRMSVERFFNVSSTEVKLFPHNLCE